MSHVVYSTKFQARSVPHLNCCQTQSKLVSKPGAAGLRLSAGYAQDRCKALLTSLAYASALKFLLKGYTLTTPSLLPSKLGALRFAQFLG